MGICELGMTSSSLPSVSLPRKYNRVASIEFDLEGDVLLTLLSSAGIAKFRVNSNILCLASPVFRAMLGPTSQFKERAALTGRTSASEPLEIPLSDDDPEALGVIMRIIHLQYGWVPSSLNADQLYKVAVICDKYDMRQSLEVWLTKWVSPLVTPPAKPVSGDRWMFIAYAFGERALFSRLTRDLILQCRSDKDGNLLTGNGNPLSEHLPGHIVGKRDVPPGTARFNSHTPLAEISARRHQTIEAMVHCIHSIVEEYMTPETPRCQFKQVACDDLALGFLVRTFKRLKIYPETSQIRSQAIQEFKALLDGVSFPSDVLLGGQTIYSCPCGQSTDVGRYCTNCRANVTLQKATSHASTCSPLLSYEGKIKNLVDSVTGLNYAKFVSIETLAKKNTVVPRPRWNCLEYS